MQEQVTRDFVAEVMSRMKKPSGIPCNEKTMSYNVRRLMTLKNLNLLDLLVDPEALYATLADRYSSAASILTLFRPAGAFLGNLTEEEKHRLGLSFTADTLQKYVRALTELTAKRKAQGIDRKRANAFNEEIKTGV